MAVTGTTKHGIPKPDANEPWAKGNERIAAVADTVDGLLTPLTSGTLSARPVSSPTNPGKLGRMYLATDTGAVYLDSGAGWIMTVAPIGWVFEWPTATPPENHLLLAGQTISATDYPILVPLLGGGSTVTLPNASGRTTIGSGTLGGTTYPLLGTGGEQAHTLTLAEAPSRIVGTAAVPETAPTKNVLAPTGGGSFNVGGFDAPHNNMQPYVVMNKIIRAR